MIYELPGYSPCGSDIIDGFIREVKKIREPDDVKTFVSRWRDIWVLGSSRKPPHVEAICSVIVSENLDFAEARRCIRRVIDTGKPCRHSDVKPLRSKKRRLRMKHLKKSLGTSKLCAGMEIFMPWTVLTTLQIAHIYQVPQSVAFHQAFCEDPEHLGCF